MDSELVKDFILNAGALGIMTVFCSRMLDRVSSVIERNSTVIGRILERLDLKETS